MSNYLKLFKDRAEYDGATTKPSFGHLIDEITLLEKPIEPIYKWVQEGTMCKNYSKYANLVEYAKYCFMNSVHDCYVRIVKIIDKLFRYKSIVCFICTLYVSYCYIKFSEV